MTKTYLKALCPLVVWLATSVAHAQAAASLVCEPDTINGHLTALGFTSFEFHYPAAAEQDAGARPLKPSKKTLSLDFSSSDILSEMFNVAAAGSSLNNCTMMIDSQPALLVRLTDVRVDEIRVTDKQPDGQNLPVRDPHARVTFIYSGASMGFAVSPPALPRLSPN